MTSCSLIEQRLCCDLVIIGAGYAGINALNAAAKYVPKGGKIVLVDKRPSLGGMWVDQYDYVTLHQPYETFTAGERKWQIKKHWSHLATKPEILEHFEYIAETCCKERDIELQRLFRYELKDYKVSSEQRLIEASVFPVNEDSTLPAVLVQANRMIKATGFKVPIKKPIRFSAGEEVNSLSPVDIMKPEVTKMIRDSISPIYVLGSGKTAIDTICKLCNDMDACNRVRCISGHGTMFINRDKVFPKGFFRRNLYGTNTFLDWLRLMANLYDGSNPNEVIQALNKQGFLHSPIEEASNFMMGISSEDEVNTARKALTPQNERVLRAHLVDILEDDGELFLKLRDLDGHSYFRVKLRRNAFIINCTDHFTTANLQFEPIISDNGLVLSPQTIGGFSGPSATFATHLYYQDLLDPLWKEMPRLELDLKNKSKFGIELGMSVLISMEILTRALPNGRALGPQSGSIPLHRIVPAILRFISAYRSLKAKIQRVIPARYTDPCEDPECETIPVLAGNIGIESKL